MVEIKIEENTKTKQEKDKKKNSFLSYIFKIKFEIRVLLFLKTKYGTFFEEGGMARIQNLPYPEGLLEALGITHHSEDLHDPL